MTKAIREIAAQFLLCLHRIKLYRIIAKKLVGKQPHYRIATTDDAAALSQFHKYRTSTEEDPTHAYDKEGVFEYTLTVTDSDGNSESFSYSIEIIKTGEGDNTPGFELVFAVIAIGLIILWKKKR